MARLFQELRRRHVLRAATAYIVAAWLILQVADIVVPAAGLPDWVLTGLLVLLALGFPISLILSWIFELTPEGLKLENEAVAAPSAGLAGRKIDFVIIGMLAAAVIVLLFRINWSGPPIEEFAPNSIAVLPFVNMSSDAENEYFSDGMSEELLNLLAKIENLTVASRTSSFYFKDRETDIPTVAQKLRVRHVLEGSVRKAGDRVRVTAQLIDAAGDRHLWSETYDRQLNDIFAVQDDIARRIVDSLRAVLEGKKAIGDAVPASRPTSMEAYQFYLQGISLLRRRGIGNIRRAAELFERSIELDPGYAPAHSELAVSYSLIPFYSAESRPLWLGRAEEAARRAITLDPTLGGPHATLAGIFQNRGTEVFARAEAEFRQAIELDPNNATAHQWYGEFLFHVGKGNASRGQLETAHRLDPLSPVVNTALAWGYLVTRDFEKARQFGETARELGMGGTWAEDLLGLVHVHAGDYERALEVWGGDHPDFELNRLVVRALMEPGRRAEAIAAINGNDRVRISLTAPELLALMGEAERALDAVLRAAERDELDLRLLWRFPTVELAADPRFTRAIEMTGLAGYWQETGWPDLCRPAGDSFMCTPAATH